MPSVHKDCGESITWLRRADDTERFMPPMDFVGYYVMVVNGVGIESPAYKIHNCDPEKVREWRAYQEDLAAAKGEDVDPYYAAKEREAEAEWAFVEGIPCPTCEVASGKCISQAQHLKKTGEVVETRHPHPSRVSHAETWKEEETP